MVDYRTTRLRTKDVGHHRAAFTLAELLVSVGVLVLLVLLATQLLNSAATVTNSGSQTNGRRLTSTTAPGSNGYRFRTVSEAKRR